MRVGVVVARFQVDDLHDGHQLLLKAVSEENDSVVVVLGRCQPKNTMENPLDYETRRLMVKEILPRASVLYIDDQPDDAVWSRNLDALIGSFVLPDTEVTLYGGRDSFLQYYTGKHLTFPFGYINHRSGTDVRAEIGRVPRASADFRAGVIYASQNRYPTSFATVDVCIWDYDGHLLLGRKKGAHAWCLVGGFVDPEDDSYETAAEREAFEETGLKVGLLTYVKSANVDDWRYRKGPDKIKTILYNAGAVDPDVARADDDLETIAWFLPNQARSVIQECHRDLLEAAITEWERHCV